MPARRRGGGGAAGGAAALTDDEIGDKAFSNPPTGLTAAEKQAVLDAVDGGLWSVEANVPANEESPQSIALDSNNVLHMLGSSTGDVWSWNGRRWAKVADAPSAEADPTGIAFDSSGTLHLVGDDGDGVWSWDGSAWTKVADVPATETASQDIAFDSNDVLYLVGAESDDVWSWDGSAWTKVADVPAAVPFPTSIAFDSYDTLYVVGVGTGGVWSWEGSAWTKVVDRPVGEGNTTGIAFDGSGALYLVGTHLDTVYRLRVSGLWRPDEGAEDSRAGEGGEASTARAVARPVGWSGYYDIAAAEEDVSFTELSGVTADLGYSAAQGGILLGDSSNQRGVLAYSDSSGLVDPEDCLMQAAMKWNPGAQWSFFFALASDLSEISGLSTGNDQRDDFAGGTVVQFNTATEGQLRIAIVETEGQTSHYPAIAHGSWELLTTNNVRIANGADEADADRRNATVVVVNSAGDGEVGRGAGALDAPAHVAVEVLRREITVFLNGIPLAIWTWADANWPLRPGVARHRDYFITSAAGRTWNVGGVSTPATQIVTAWGLTQGRRTAPDPARFV